MSTIACFSKYPKLAINFKAPYKKIEKTWFFHNPTRANVGSIGIVPDVPIETITSPEYLVWRLKGGYLPEFMALIIRTDYFLELVAFNRVGGVNIMHNYVVRNEELYNCVSLYPRLFVWLFVD